MIELAGKNVHVVGLGLSGVAAAELCLRHGARVTGVDRRPRGVAGAAPSVLAAKEPPPDSGACEKAAERGLAAPYLEQSSRARSERERETVWNTR